MPLALQALLPLLALLLAALAVSRRPRHPQNGWIALGATTLASAITLAELLRLATGERVDVPYLTTFPYADLAIRLDPLSLGFSTVVLLTAALLMLVRLRSQGDRRDPWLAWLLTTAAALAVMLAASLLLTYILLQVLTLAWSGTLDESAPRRRLLRLSILAADIGLLLVAASAIQSVGTSAYSGVPSDTFGLAAVGLALLPVLVRIAALAWPRRGTMASVTLEPAVAFAAPAGYLLLRMLALMGGLLPGRGVAVLVFALGLLLAAGAALLTVTESHSTRVPAYLLLGQAALGLALLASSLPLLALASAWLWLELILVTGLCSVSPDTEKGAGLLALLTLSLLPGTTGFVPVLIAAIALRAGGQNLALFAIVAVALLLAFAGLSRIRRIDRWSADVPTGWAVGLLLIAALPSAFLPLVLPVAGTVRSLPAGAVLLSPLGFTVGGLLWPAPFAVIVLVGLLALLGRSRARLQLAPPGVQLPALPRSLVPPVRMPPRRWMTRLSWTAFIALIGLAVLRP